MSKHATLIDLKFQLAASCYNKGQLAHRYRALKMAQNIKALDFQFSQLTLLKCPFN